MKQSSYRKNIQIVSVSPVYHHCHSIFEPLWFNSNSNLHTVMVTSRQHSLLQTLSNSNTMAMSWNLKKRKNEMAQLIFICDSLQKKQEIWFRNIKFVFGLILSHKFPVYYRLTHRFDRTQLCYLIYQHFLINLIWLQETVIILQQYSLE